MNRRNFVLNDNIIIANSWILTIFLLIFFFLMQSDHSANDLLSFNGIVFLIALVLPLVNALLVTFNSRVRNFYLKEMKNSFGICQFLYLIATIGLLNDYNSSASVVKTLLGIAAWLVLGIVVYIFGKKQEQKKAGN